MLKKTIHLSKTKKESMAIVINMPRLSDTMTDGVVAKWHKQIGDSVNEGDLLAEIETDKATMEFEAFPGQEGKLLYIGTHEGEAAPGEDWLDEVKSVIFRTEQHAVSLTREYSNTNWPFLAPEIGSFLRSSGIDHLVIDQPSVDQEEDGGALACHRSFWGPTPLESLHRTITELAHIPTDVCDGAYLLNLQVAPLDNDAAPSRPILYRLI